MKKIKTIQLTIVGMGLIFYSPFSASGINEGEDYLASNFEDPIQVQTQAIQGKIVGVNLGTPGSFILEIFSGYPSEEQIDKHQFKLRIGVEVRGNKMCVRDLFDLMDWSNQLAEEQSIQLDDGFYHVTLLSDAPASGLLGENQMIEIYLQHLNEMPKLKFNGVPTLC